MLGLSIHASTHYIFNFSSSKEWSPTFVSLITFSKKKIQNTGMVPVPIPSIILMETATGGVCGFNRNTYRFFKSTVAVFKKHHSPTM